MLQHVAVAALTANARNVLTRKYGTRKSASVISGIPLGHFRPAPGAQKIEPAFADFSFLVDPVGGDFWAVYVRSNLPVQPINSRSLCAI